MSNRNYINGRSKEYRLISKLKKEGYLIVFRTAGSHSPIDVVAISKGHILFIQSKPKKFSDNKKKELEQEYLWLNTTLVSKFEVR